MWENFEKFTKRERITFTINAHKTYFWVSEIIVPAKKRGKGLGSQAMKLFLEIAKKTLKNVKLVPLDICKTTDICKLRDFYGKFNFKNKGRMMVWYHREN